MSLTEKDSKVYECPKCKKTGTYRPVGTDRYKETVYECSTPDCGRRLGEKSLESEIRRKD